MTRHWGHRVVATVIAALMAGVSAPSALAVDDLVLSVPAGSQSVAPGDTVTVTLDVANLGADINGVQALLRYDAAMMTLVSIVPTDLGLVAPNQGWVTAFETDVAGDITWAGAINGGSMLADHTVATLTFTAIGEGTTSVVFRLDAPPFLTKLTAALDNATVLPTTGDSVLIVSQCDDGVYCNGTEFFDGLVCLPGADPCDDGVGCTDDVCDEAFDTCTNTANDANCDDALFCNGAETCDATLDCQPGADPCNDGVGCTDDTCDEVNDSCTNAANDANCPDDGLFCTGLELCDATLDCIATGTPCLPGLFCNDTTDTCDQCVIAVDCDDGVGCTDDSCVSGSCVNAANDTFCDDGLFCNGAETCDPTLDCQAGSDPCTPLVCDEGTDFCFAPIHVASVEVFYAGRYLTCHGGTSDGVACTSDANCPSGTCQELADSSRQVLAVGSTATIANVTNYIHGTTGVRVTFDNLVDFATTADAAFSFEWTTGAGTTFSAVTDAAIVISVTPTVQNGVTVANVLLADDYVRRRWLKVTIDSAQVTSLGVALDGELSGSPAAYPTGDGTPGGNTVFFLGNTSGDVNGDRKTLLEDVGIVRAGVNPFIRVPVTNVYDVDKDGKVLLGDTGATRAAVNPFFTLPLISP